jgi:hypothetical protein
VVTVIEAFERTELKLGRHYLFGYGCILREEMKGRWLGVHSSGYEVE